MNAVTRDKISVAQRQNWATRRALDEEFEALKSSKRQVLEALDLCSLFVEMRADEGDPFARFLKARVETAYDGLKSENIAAATLIEENTTQPDIGCATG
ncbi:MAG: hypothetical protein M3454_16860 [Actinomycetota bacterium]|nr:hypothetical protein [Actinomycetota bacterium]